MQKHLKHIASLFIPFAFIISCKKKSEPEPDLVGKWTDDAVIYYFNADKTYGQKYLLNGAGKDTILIDSTFGNYMTNPDKKLISFNQKGYYDKSKKLVPEAKNGTTWHYELTGNTLKYTSNTVIGQLTRTY